MKTDTNPLKNEMWAGCLFKILNFSHNRTFKHVRLSKQENTYK